MVAEPRIAGCLLYVEDDEVTRRALGASLERMVETLVVADSGAAGLAALERCVPDLVITDIAMPGMSGLSMAREIKRTRPDLPIVVTTAHSDTEFLLEAIELGIDGYVTKPVDFDRVFSLVRRNLAAVAHARAVEREHEEQRRLVAELQTALAEVHRLKGLIPICSYCKAMRNDEGYWASLEQYLAEHAGATLSHGICPRCAALHFADYT